KSHFYTMILAQSLPCILCFLYLEIIVRPRKFGMYILFKPQLQSSLAQFTFFVQQLLTTAVYLSFIPFAANRFVAVKFPERYLVV
ncbi:hypothetical protein PFISCL1PPCAC_21464, partial [Pristionchus fissidentatus]